MQENLKKWETQGRKNRGEFTNLNEILFYIYYCG